MNGPHLLTANMGSVAERQDFSRSEAKPPYRFRDRASAPLMTVDGWEVEGLLPLVYRFNLEFIGGRRQVHARK